VLGKLACRVLSKILGIGSAERNQKQVKKIKRGDRAQTGIDKTAKQVLVYAQYQMLHGKLCKTTLSCAGKLWEDTDFDCMKLDAYCKDLQEEATNANLQNKPIQCVRNVRLWQESWEVPKRYGGKWQKLLEAWLEKKYIGLKLNKMEGYWMIYTFDMIELDGCRNKKYQFWAVTKSYNDDLVKRDDENDGKYAYYAFSAETYLWIAEYYKDHPNEGGVRIFMPDDDCDSEDPGNE
jgi:hypothetical protein